MSISPDPRRRIAMLPHIAIRVRYAALAACLALASPVFAQQHSESAKPQTVKVAAVQCSSDLGAVEANIKKLTGLVREAAREGAKIVVLPEACVTGYLSQDLKTNWHLKDLPIEKFFTNGKDPAEFAEPVPGPSTKHFAALAKELEV